MVVDEFVANVIFCCCCCERHGLPRIRVLGIFHRQIDYFLVIVLHHLPVSINFGQEAKKLRELMIVFFFSPFSH